MQLQNILNYIHNVILILKEEADSIKNKLDSDNYKSEITNRSASTEIKRLEYVLARAKSILAEIKNRDNLDIPEEWWKQRAALIEFISTWRSKKTKMTRDDEALRVAGDFHLEVLQKFHDFCHYVDKDCEFRLNKVLESLATSMSNSAFESNNLIFPKSRLMTNRESVEFPVVRNLAVDLMKICNEDYVPAQGGLFGLFKSSDNTKAGMVLEKSYNYSSWRMFVQRQIMPHTDKIIDANFNKMKAYEALYADTYSKWLLEVIATYQKKKEEASGALSTEEQYVQIDNDWFTTFNDMLEDIERV